MKQTNTTKSLLLSALAVLGLAASAFAGGDEARSPMSGPAPGLLGQAYAGLTYSQVNLDASPVNADRYGFEYNEPIKPGFDAVFNYDWTQSGAFAGRRMREHELAATLRAFSTNQSWGLPYVEGGIGYDWVRFAGARDSSFVWIAGAGVEFQATAELTVTPFVRYERAHGFADNNDFNYGVKANYWFSPKCAFTAAISRNDRQDTAGKVGINIRY